MKSCAGHPRKSLVKMLAATALLSLCSVAFLVFTRLHLEPIPKELRIREREIALNIEPKKLRQWAIEVRRKLGHDDHEVEVPAQDVPGVIRALVDDDVPRILIAPTGQKDELIRMLYGGGLGHWSITVGTTNYLPRYDRKFDTLVWTEGIYFDIPPN
jgi:hypothetical protein